MSFRSPPQRCRVFRRFVALAVVAALLSQSRDQCVAASADSVATALSAQVREDNKNYFSALNTSIISSETTNFTSQFSQTLASLPNGSFLKYIPSPTSQAILDGEVLNGNIRNGDNGTVPLKRREPGPKEMATLAPNWTIHWPSALGGHKRIKRNSGDNSTTVNTSESNTITTAVAQELSTTNEIIIPTSDSIMTSGAGISETSSSSINSTSSETPAPTCDDIYNFSIAENQNNRNSVLIAWSLMQGIDDSAVICIGASAERETEKCSVTETCVEAKQNHLNLRVACFCELYNISMTVKCTNAVEGQTYYSEYITVPGPPKDLQVTLTSNTSLILEWKMPDCVVDSYEVFINSSDIQQYHSAANTTNEKITFSDLQPYTNYSLWVAARTSAGQGDWSETKHARTDVDYPSEPQDFQTLDYNSSSIHVTWVEPIEKLGPIDGYVFSWHKTNDAGNGKSENVGKTLSYVLSGLTPWTNYTLQLSAYNINKNNETLEGNYVTMIQNTGESDPSEPQDFQTLDYNSSSIHVTWVEPIEKLGPIDGYVFSWHKTNDAGNGKSENVGKTLSYVLSGLTPWTNYTLQLSAYNINKNNETLEGNYVTMVQNTGESVPGPPKGVRITSVTNVSLTLEWKIPDSVNGILRGYEAFINSSDIQQYHSAANTTDEKITFSDLEPYTNYSLWVAARTSVGLGDWSEIKHARTDVGYPNEPQDFETLDYNSSSIHVTWMEPTEKRGPVDGYVFIWRKTNDAGNGKIENVGKTLSYVLSGLIPWTNYTLQLSAYNINKNNETLEENYVTMIQNTGESVPGPPKDVRITSVTNVSLTSEWKIPDFVNGILRGYEAFINSSDIQQYHSAANTTDEKITFSDLKPYTNYSLWVAARTSVGLGDWSEIKHARTDVGYPSEPQDFKTLDYNSSSIHVTWVEPIEKLGPIDGYVFSWHKTNDAGNGKSENVGKTLSYVLSDLIPWTNYTLQLSAYNINKNNETLEGNYVKMVQNTGESVPGPPKDVRITSVTNVSLTLEWKIPDSVNGILRGYEAFINSSDIQQYHSAANTTDEKKTFSDLEPYTNYSLWVAARTSVGLGDWSEIKHARTDVGLSSLPDNLHVQDYNDTALFLEWENPKEKNGPINGFKVFWEKSGDTELQSNLSAGSENVHSYVIADLAPWTNYTIKVNAYNINNEGDVLDGNQSLTEKRTAAAVPNEPEIADVHVMNSRRVSIRWKYPGIFPGPTNYSVQVWMTYNCSSLNKNQFVKSQREKEVFAPLPEYYTEMGGLSPYTNYFFVVEATTEAGSRNSGQSPGIKTEPDSPGPPDDINVNCSISPTSVSISWKSPLIPNGVIREYMINYQGEKNGKLTSGTERYSINATESCHQIEHITQLDDLLPENSYSFTIRAKTEGVETFGEAKRYHDQCSLPAGVPPFPSNLSKEEIREHTAVIVLSNETFSSEMGDIMYYSIIVAYPENIGEPRNGSSNDAEQLPFWTDFWKDSSKNYQATPKYWNPFKAESYDPLNCQQKATAENGEFLHCTIGWEKNCSQDIDEYCNGLLRPGKRYGIKLRGFTRGGFSETFPLYIETVALKEGSSLGLIIGLVISVLIVTALIAVIIISRRKRVNLLVYVTSLFGKHHSEPEPSNEIPCNEILSVEKFSRPLNFMSFLEHVKVMMSDSSLRFSLEFEQMKQDSPKHLCSAAEMEENRSKNRWMNIFPFDHSRVKLLPIDDEPGSDYVNANYIPGHSSQREYIASQGPLPTTVDDFWRMIWEQGVTMIVMLTQCVERGKPKCEQYWPGHSESVYYGDLKLQMKSESILSVYSIRIVDLQLGNRQRTVKQMHFTRWPDFGSPESPDELINFVRAVRDHLPHTNTGPILVHCSAGVGRTGTFIAVDRLSQHIESQDFIDIHSTVMHMREYRTNMVQTEDQYIYIHKCMRDLIQEKLNMKSLCRSDDNYDDELYSNMSIENDTGV